MPKIHDFLTKIEMISYYPIYYYQNTRLLYPAPDTASDLPLICDSALAVFLRHSEQFVTDPSDSDVFYYVSHFSTDITCILGPFSHLASQKDVQQRYCIKHCIENKFSYPIKKATIEQAQNAMLLIRDILVLSGICSISDTPSAPENIETISSDPLPQEKEEYQFQEYLLNNTSLTLPQAPYSLEKELIETLQFGDEQEFYATLKKINQYQPGPYATTSLKAAEYGAVMLTTFFTRAVIDIGVPLKEAYALSDTLLTNIASVHSLQEYEQIATRLFRQFLYLVKKHKSSEEKSPYIKHCKTYILHHLNQPLTPNILADVLSINKDYLLHLFSACERITLMEYIRKARVQAAQNMLKYSDFDILRIATYYQFKTQSHFSMVFKKYTGMTPKQYRNANKPDAFYNKSQQTHE